MNKHVLTKFELDLLQALFDQDGSIKLAASSLNITPTSARNTLHRNIFNKLQVNSLCGAHRAGLALNLIDLKVSIEKAPPVLLDSSQAL